MAKEDSVGLSFYDVNGQKRAAWNVSRDGRSDFGFLGKGPLMRGNWTVLPEGGVQFAIRDNRGKERIIMDVPAEDPAKFNVRDHNGASVFQAP
jgi:hypothetical protein